MTLDGIIFDNMNFSPFVVTFECVRSKTPVYPRVLCHIVIHIVAKGEIFESIVLEGTKNSILLCESLQD